MGSFIVTGLAIIGGLGALFLGLLVVAELYAEKEQREGENPFE